MKRAAWLVILGALLAGCSTHQEWKEQLRAAREQWQSCAVNATALNSRKYSDPDMVARYAMHLCEPKKFALIDTFMLKREAIRGNFMEFVEKDETRLRERMQMFATKWMADQDAQLDQGFPEPLVFGKP